MGRHTSTPFTFEEGAMPLICRRLFPCGRSQGKQGRVKILGKGEESGGRRKSHESREEERGKREREEERRKSLSEES
jgi:hypothetical protein